ncbi:MAG: Flp pilus assembly protein CpaB [Deltaproteobacteria bacterium]|nr:Flp pilus assembly protein CpaB [Deltaproteobacteria bacterium]
MAAKPRAVLVIGVIAVIIAGVASIFLYSYLKTQEERVGRAVATRRIVAAAVEIPAGAAIGAGHVAIAEWPEASVPQGALVSTGEALGRVAVIGIQRGDSITEAKLVPKGGPAGILSYRIPEGHRAMTVGVDKVSGVAGFISPGNMVDVIVTATAGAGEPISKIFLQNVPILATGRIIEQQQGGEPAEVPTVTLDVTPQDAERLALASSQGKLQLVLRRAGDKVESSTAGATIQRVIYYGGAVKAAPGKKAEAKAERPMPQKFSVEVLRSSTRSVESFGGKE